MNFRLASTLSILLTLTVAADDWPAFRHDVRRSATTAEALEFPLQRAWSYQSRQKPDPAWPPPHFIILNRLDFDYAPQPVIANGVVYFGSTSDDTVRALDLATGKTRWEITVGGPVRIPPQAAGGRVYFGSDDGHAYCVDAESGELIWEFNGAPHAEMCIGNRRMISRWPVRTGVLVEDGVAYFAAGIWATEGVFVYAVDADSGAEIWCNDTADYAGLDFNTLLTTENRAAMRHGVHDGDFGFYGLTPQGALAVTDETLLIPNGYNTTAGLNRKTGQLLFAEPSAGSGGSWVRAGSDAFYTMYRHRNMRVLLKKCDARTGERISLQQHHIFNASQLRPSEAQAKWISHEPGQTSIVVREDGKHLSRNAFALAMAGETLILGGDGFVSAVDPETDDEIWKTVVKGKVYGLAIAGGRLIATTGGGEVICFGGVSAKAPDTPTKPAELPPAEPDMLAKLRESGMDRGYALVFGASGARLAETLLGETDLRFVIASDDPAEVQQLRTDFRERLPQFLGSRLHAPNAASGLPLADYFANAIFITEAEAPSSEELIRVLRPCGGVIISNGDVETVRGRLPGAHDWDSDDLLDRRAKWPLRPLWFGGPSSAQVTNHKNENQRALAANGRYFVLGEDTLTAVDAYNGSILWTRPIPKRSPDLREAGGVLHPTSHVWSRELRDAHRRSLRANGDFVFLHLQEGHFDGAGAGIFAIDARNGAQDHAYAPYETPPETVLDSAKTFEVGEDAGTLTLAVRGSNLIFKSEVDDETPTELDEWDLIFDFRAPERRFGLFDDDVARIRAKLNATVEIPLRTRSFGLAAILNSHDGGADERVQRTYVFGSLGADGLNAGWPNFRFDGSTSSPSKPAIIRGAAADFPRQKLIAGFPKAIDSAVANEPRVHPLTGELGPRIFRSGTGTCGGFDFSATSVIKRSGAAKVLGIYDFAEDSGLHTFVGVSAGCGPTTLTSQGLVIVSEAKARCVCTYPFRTSMAMAPGQRRLNEDWAIFFDRDVDTRVRHAMLNLGAPGDRRDGEGNLWLGFPRPATQSDALGYPKLPGTKTEAYLPGVWPIARQASLHVPLEIEGGEPYRINGDRTAFAADTQQLPWLYASGYRGLRKATLQLNFLKPLATQRLNAAPAIDGKLAPNEWPEQPARILTETKSQLFLANDETHLFIAARHPTPELEGKSLRRGEVVWKAETEGEDAEIWNDDGCEIFLTDAKSGRVLHLGASLSGARFDANDEDIDWSGNWRHAAKAEASGMDLEFAIPWTDLESAGLDRSDLQLNILVNRDAKTGEALCFLGADGRDACSNFVPLGIGKLPEIAPRRFRVNLHFSEPELTAGERVFDVAIQGKPVLESFDIAAVAGGRRIAVVRHFEPVEANDSLRLEFAPRKGEPIVSAIAIEEIE